MPLNLDAGWIEDLRKELPELPGPKMKRLMEQYAIAADDALFLTGTPAMAQYFEDCARISGNPRAAANWIMGDLAYNLKNSGKDIVSCPVAAKQLAELIRTVDSGEISGKIAKTVFEEMFRTAEDPAPIIERMGLVQVSDAASLEPIIDKLVDTNPRQAEEFRSGKTKIIGFFVGQVMKQTGGQANPKIVNELLRKKLKG
jgi:aspartyl-tRNA(Asn)/glutamyl-tRNA(Gln) amidotransferase subunit B